MSGDANPAGHAMSKGANPTGHAMSGGAHPAGCCLGYDSFLRWAGRISNGFTLQKKFVLFVVKMSTAIKAS